MINTSCVLKASLAWISVLYVICFVGVALFPSIREGFALYALHTDIDLGRNVETFGTFLSGLIIWNVVTYLSVWLFVALYNNIKVKK